MSSVRYIIIFSWDIFGIIKKVQYIYSMISIILSSRVKNNPNSNIHRLLRSIQSCGGDMKNCEVLIKYDYDDDEKPKDKEFNYPFNIKTFTWDRYDGRYSLHIDYQYLFMEIDERSKLVINIADDFYFTRTNIFNELLSITDDYLIIFSHDHKEAENDINYRIKKKFFSDCELMVMSTKLITILGGFGFQPNTDNWTQLLHVILIQKYNINISKKVEVFYERCTSQSDWSDKKECSIIRTYDFTNYNKKFYFDLIEQQSKNIYLNLLESGNVYRYKHNNEI